MGFGSLLHHAFHLSRLPCGPTSTFLSGGLLHTSPHQSSFCKGRYYCICCQSATFHGPGVTSYICSSPRSLHPVLFVLCQDGVILSSLLYIVHECMTQLHAVLFFLSPLLSRSPRFLTRRQSLSIDRKSFEGNATDDQGAATQRFAAANYARCVCGVSWYLTSALTRGRSTENTTDRLYLISLRCGQLLDFPSFVALCRWTRYLSSSRYTSHCRLNLVLSLVFLARPVCYPYPKAESGMFPVPDRLIWAISGF